ncbi:DUF5013 domain-containing protein [Niastella caeni]|uniref:DUF5013 domain-containing protein n=1 Tax=Niastella caeni TaxID=2569763 RepID=A0A4S8HWL6_9BACT|nr:DUF4998 domain-containing protein [Niastella caeni]THU39631.1 DUF5013 domain-containing protein [Niastella caeni]
MKLLQTICYILFLTGIMVSCKKADDFKKFIEDGEIIYTAKADSARVYPGNKRVQVSWLLITDPTITTSKVFWKNHTDSVVIAVNRTSSIDTMRVFINNLPEGNYDFEVYNYDKDGNSSIKVEVSGTVYGDVYTSSLLARAVENAELLNNNGEITWGDADSSTGVIGMQLKYIDINNNTHDTVVKAIYKDQVTVLPGLMPGAPVQYRTLYKPAVLAIDTFYTSYENLPVKADVTATFIKNAGAPFLLDHTQPSNWRFGQLADWLYNDEARDRYTYDAINGTGNACMTLWIWDNGTLTNGKIYQTVMLPAGEYVLEATVSNIDNSLEATYLAVAAGNALPNVEDITTAIGYGRFTNNSNKLVSASFALSSSATITLGVVGSMANPTAQTIRISKVKLVKNK